MEVKREIKEKVIMEKGKKEIEIREEGEQSIMEMKEMKRKIDKVIDMENISEEGEIWDNFEKMLNGGKRKLRI